MEMRNFMNGIGAAVGEPLAERVGFEPTDGCPSLVFKTSPLNRSGISPAVAR